MLSLRVHSLWNTPRQYDLCRYTNCPDVLQQWPEHSLCLPGSECAEVQVTEEVPEVMSSENDRAELWTITPWLQGQYSSITERLPLPAPPLVALYLGSLASFLFTSSILFSLNGYSPCTLDSRPPPAPFACYFSPLCLCFFNFCVLPGKSHCPSCFNHQLYVVDFPLPLQPYTWAYELGSQTGLGWNINTAPQHLWDLLQLSRTISHP